MNSMPSRGAAGALALASPVLALPAFADATARTASHWPGHHRHAGHRTQLALIPPIKPLSAPAHPAATYEAALVPDPAITLLADNSDQHTSRAPAVMQFHYPLQGDGYAAGSSAQAMDDRETAKVTGVQLKMPLGQ